MSYGIHMLVEE